MNEPLCPACNAAWIPGANFCRWRGFDFANEEAYGFSGYIDHYICDACGTFIRVCRDSSGVEQFRQTLLGKIAKQEGHDVANA